MSRERKFRAWNRIVRRMQYFKMEDLQELKDKIQWQNLDVTDFTGLLDKNKKEIYEKDIVKTGYGKIGLVYYHIERAGFILHDANHFNEMLYQEIADLEIIGNIYESHELLNSEPTDERGVTTKSNG